MFIFYINSTLFLTDDLIKEIKNDIIIAEQRLEEPIVNKLKYNDFLMINKTND